MYLLSNFLVPDLVNAGLSGSFAETDNLCCCQHRPMSFFAGERQFFTIESRVGVNTAFIICVLVVMLISLCPCIVERW